MARHAGRKWMLIEPPPSALIASTVLEMVEDIDG